MFPERIETDRLELTALTPDSVDVLEYYEVCSGSSDEEFDAVTEHLPWDPHDTPKETKEFLDRLAAQREAGENAEYAVRPKDPEDAESAIAGEDRTGELAGAVGLTPNWERRTGELGIWLRKPYWGRGYYGEAFAELSSVAFDRLDLEFIEILHRHGNANSRSATETFVEDLGGRYEGRLRNYRGGPDGPDDLHRYTISKAEYEETSETEFEETSETEFEEASGTGFEETSGTGFEETSGTGFEETSGTGDASK